MTDKVLEGPEAHIHQIGVVVKDLDKTVSFLTAIGLGPFIIRNAKHPAATVNGQKESYEVRIAISQQGPLQFELIEYVEGKTIQKDFLDCSNENQLMPVYTQMTAYYPLLFKLMGLLYVHYPG